MKTSEPNGAFPPPMKTTTAAIIVTAVFAVACGVILLCEISAAKKMAEARKKLEDYYDDHFI